MLEATRASQSRAARADATTTPVTMRRRRGPAENTCRSAGRSASGAGAPTSARGEPIGRHTPRACVVIFPRSGVTGDSWWPLPDERTMRGR